MNRYFADVSNNNTQPMNFHAYKRVGKHVLVGHKATEGISFVDRFHHQRVEQAHKEGVHVIHYHFGHASESPAKQAEAFWHQIKNHFGRRDFACIDIEAQGADGRDNRAVATWVNLFDIAFRKISGHSLIGYSNEAMLRELVTAGVNVHGDRWWVAAYGPRKPSVGGVHTWAWQFTDGNIGPMPHQTQGVGRSDISILNWRTYLRLRMTRP